MQRPRRSKGTVLVELAFCLPLICAILLVIMDYGYMMYVLISMQSAARAGAYAGIHDTVWSADEIAEITYHADQGKSFSRDDVTVNLNSTDASFGTTLPTVEVQINHTHRFLVPFLLPTIRLSDSNAITLRARAKAIVVPGMKLR